MNSILVVKERGYELKLGGWSPPSNHFLKWIELILTIPLSLWISVTGLTILIVSIEITRMISVTTVTMVIVISTMTIMVVISAVGITITKPTVVRSYHGPYYTHGLSKNYFTICCLQLRPLC